jgi:hypothetical protein
MKMRKGGDGRRKTIVGEWKEGRVENEFDGNSEYSDRRRETKGGGKGVRGAGRNNDAYYTTICIKHTYTYTHIYTHTYIRTYTRAHVHIYIHTYQPPKILFRVIASC